MATSPGAAGSVGTVPTGSPGASVPPASAALGSMVSTITAHKNRDRIFLYTVNHLLYCAIGGKYAGICHILFSKAQLRRFPVKFPSEKRNKPIWCLHYTIFSLPLP